MKRILALIMTLLISVSFFGCGEAEESPETSTNPVYTVTGEIPETEELRQMAVKAMRDLLSIQWTPSEQLDYYNTAGRDKQFAYVPGTIYGGVLYSGSSTGLLHFMEFYDQETGVLTYPGTPDELRKNIGTGCADSLLWSWATVSNSFNCGYYPSQMVYKNGFLPVGSYTYDKNIASFYYLPTQNIIKNNGQKVMLESYAQMLPADALISSTVDHAIMVIEKPTVVRNGDGTVAMDASYVYIQDQRGGTSKGFLEEIVDGKTVQFNSARRLKMTFRELYEKNYIPITVAEFTGEKAYEHASVTLTTGACSTLEQAKAAIIEANYPIAVLRLVVTDNAGTETVLDRVLIHSSTPEGPARSYNTANWAALQEVTAGSYQKLRIEVLVSTGQVLTPIDITP